MDDRGWPFKVFSELLHYPDERLMKRLPDLQALVEDLPAALRENIGAFISGIGSEPTIRLQETYTAAFYMGSKTTLNMAYHRWGNSGKRAMALAGLERAYREAGYERIDGELPDFLPLMLEFLSINPLAEQNELFAQCLSGVGTLSARLRETDPPYAALLDTLACFLRDRLGEDGHRNPEREGERATATDPSGGAPREQGENHGPCS